MAEQYVNYRFSRPIMSMFRCTLSAAFFALLIHAAAVFPTPVERWEKGFIFNSRLSDKLTYQDAIASVPHGELMVVIAVFAMLRSIYISCGCHFAGEQNRVRLGFWPRVEFVFLCTPYLGIFFGTWLFTTYTTIHQLATRQPSNTTANYYCHLCMVLIFKMIILSQLTSFCLRTYVVVLRIEADWRRGIASPLNFGERLNMLFRN